MKATIYEPGDANFTCGDSKVSKLIRWFTRDKGEAKTLTNHVGLVIKGGTIHGTAIIEAVRTVQSGPLMKRYGPPKRDRVAVYRFLPMTADQAEIITRAAESYEGRKYGYHKIAAHALDRLIGGRYVFRRLAGMADYPICSWLVAYSFEKAGIGFGVPTDAATPDDIWDWVTTHPEQWLCVRPMTTLG